MLNLGQLQYLRHVQTQQDAEYFLSKMLDREEDRLAYLQEWQYQTLDESEYYH